MTRPGPRRAPDRGQATVELLGMLPVTVVVLLAVLQLLAAGAARELAGHAAGAGAIALLEQADPGRAARDSVPGWSHDRMRVHVRGSRVTVRMVPRTLLPGFAGLLATTVRADAGDAT